MPRVVKHRDIRRAEILDQAFTIFLKRGYDNTSSTTSSPPRACRRACSTITSLKEALLVALFERVTEGMYEALRPVVEEEGVDPRTRLQNIMNRGAEFRLANVELTRSVFGSLLRPESSFLYQRVVDAWSARMRPVVTAVIEEGVAQGVFDTFNAEGVADTMLLHAASTRDATWRGMAAKTIEDARGGDRGAGEEPEAPCADHEPPARPARRQLPDRPAGLRPPLYRRAQSARQKPKAATPKATGPRQERTARQRETSVKPRHQKRRACTVAFILRAEFLRQHRLLRADARHQRP